MPETLQYPKAMISDETKQRLELANRVKQAIATLKRGGKRKVAEACGVSDQAVTGWIKNGRIDKKHLVVISRMTGFDLVGLITGDYIEGEVAVKVSPLQGNVEHGPILRGKVPLISSIQAGLWCEAIDNFHVGDHETLLDCPKKCGVNTYALRVKGDSMTNPIPGGKTYPEGTIIFVDPSQAITSGCRVIAKLPYSNEATFKEYREEDGKRWLKPLNPTYDKIEVTEDIKICGVVIGKWEDD